MDLLTPARFAKTATMPDANNQMRKPRLSSAERTAIAVLLKDNMALHGNRGSHGKVTELVARFNVTPKTISQIRKKLVENINRSISDFAPQFHKRGRKKFDREALQQTVAAIPLFERQNFPSIAVRTPVSAMTIWRMIQEKSLRVHSSCLRPALRDAVKQDCVDFAIDQLNETKTAFKQMYDVVHIDEKWFEITKVNCRYILTPTESNPERGVQLKCHIPKIMFLCAVARPRRVGNAHFDGKIGIWPFAHQVPAMRNSINRPAGTLVWTLHNVNTEAYTEMLRDKVIPAIHDKFPHEVTPLITIQHDNATPHKAMDDEAVEDYAMQARGLNIAMEFQPSNSPDTNVLDLGFFSFA